MFHFSLIQMARRMRHKLDDHLRKQFIDFYRPFKWVPRFIHRSIENLLKSVKTYPVIIEFDEKEELTILGKTEVKNKIKKHFRCRVRHEFENMSSCSARLNGKLIEKLLTNEAFCVKKIYHDRKVHALLDVASPALGVPELQEDGYTGKGITIAIVDTGIYPHHDLTLPLDRIVGFKDFINHKKTPYDDNGHGTHCAGCAAGNGCSSQEKYKGPAYEANLIGVKVLDKNGSGRISTIIAGIDWCISNRPTINIISMSLGGQATVPAKEDPLVKAVESAWDNGIVVVVAAGNEGPAERTISSPGISPKVITVGALDDANTIGRSDDAVASFSSRGPTVDGEVKPDLVVPGVNIISLRSPGSTIDCSEPDSQVNQYYTSLSGTSMATPLCAGVIALLLQKEPDLTPDEVKDRLTGVCEDLGVDKNVQGHGYLNAAKLFDQRIDN
ncbi:S8 family peptidase [Fictibacillus sp. Mic-4]|uniref:S8 family peptidase n=1 Tax=Fictibacillus TaxID=1329200 RepID=UPI000422D890|nr:S8 family peptidase [Fictibacillus gelatini]